MFEQHYLEAEWLLKFTAHASSLQLALTESWKQSRNRSNSQWGNAPDSRRKTKGRHAAWGLTAARAEPHK